MAERYDLSVLLREVEEETSAALQSDAALISQDEIAALIHERAAHEQVAREARPQDEGE